MLGGDLDVAYVGWAPPISAIARGLDAKVVCSVQSVGSVLCIRPDIPYDGPGTSRSDASVLAGKKFGVLPPGSTDHTEFDYFLTLKGIIGKAQLVPMGIPDAVTALQSGAIDGHWVPEPGGTFSEFNGHGKVVLTSSESGPFLKNHACCCVLASGAMQQNHPDVVEKIDRNARHHDALDVGAPAGSDRHRFDDAQGAQAHLLALGALESLALELRPVSAHSDRVVFW